MSRADRPSFITIPEHEGQKTILEFMQESFPHIKPSVWLERIEAGKVFVKDSSKNQNKNQIVSTKSMAQPQQIIGYYREITQEPTIPFAEQIIAQNDNFLIAHKPHFLPVMPAGVFVNECLQQRLIRKTGIKELQAAHRLDRDTAGLVLFSTKPATRGLYHQLFADRAISKQYQAVATTNSDEQLVGKKWHIKNHIKRSQPSFLFENTDDTEHAQYAESMIECIGQSRTKALFSLSPITGRTHQLRLHMQHIGFPILNDRFYPTLQTKQPDNFQSPLQLLAKSLSFVDPMTQREETFKSATDLAI